MRKVLKENATSLTNQQVLKATTSCTKPLVSPEGAESKTERSLFNECLFHTELWGQDVVVKRTLI